jgi:hypothetical protein
VFECIYQHCNWISPSLSHCNVFATHTHLHIFFSLYTMTPFPTCYTTTFLFPHSRWSIPTFIQSILTFHIYTSPHIPHSTFYVVTGCAEHSGAQVIFRNVPHITILLAWIIRKDDVSIKINIILTLTSWSTHEATVVSHDINYGFKHVILKGLGDSPNFPNCQKML